MICKPSIMSNRTKQLLQINLHFSKITLKAFSETLMGTNPNFIALRCDFISLSCTSSVLRMV